MLLLVIWHGDSQLPCILELDAFGLLMFLTYLMPFALCHTYDVSIYSKNHKTGKEEDEPAQPSVPGRMSIQPPVGSPLDHHNLRLIFTIHVCQIIISMSYIAKYTEPHDESCDCRVATSQACFLGEDIEALRIGAGTVELLRPLLFYLWAKPREGLSDDNPTREVFPIVRAHLDCDKLWEEVSKRM